jgi:hypothetical protein
VDTIFGAILSVIYFFTFFLAHNNSDDTSINAIAIILIILPTVFYTSPYFAIGGVSSVLIGVFVLFTMPNTSIIYIVGSYFIYLAGATLIYYLFPKITKTLQTVIAHIIFIIGEIILIIVMDYGTKVLNVPSQNKL